jgi:hypothetical protein
MCLIEEARPAGGWDNSKGLGRLSAGDWLTVGEGVLFPLSEGGLMIHGEGMQA